MKKTLPYLLSLSALLCISGCDGSNSTYNDTNAHDSSSVSSLHKIEGNKLKTEQIEREEKTSFSTMSETNTEVGEKAPTISATGNNAENNGNQNASASQSKHSGSSSSSEKSSSANDNQPTEALTPKLSNNKGDCKIYNPITGGCEAY